LLRDGCFECSCSYQCVLFTKAADLTGSSSDVSFPLDGKAAGKNGILAGVDIPDRK